jgi:hypothetical protein
VESLSAIAQLTEARRDKRAWESKEFSMNRFFGSLLVLFGIASVGNGRTFADTRRWTDITGKHSVEAELITASDAEVLLRNRQGNAIRVPLQRLSNADQFFLSSLKRQNEPPRNDDTTFPFLTAPVQLYLKTSLDSQHDIMHELSREKSPTQPESTVTVRVDPGFQGRGRWEGKWHSTGRVAQIRATIRLRKLRAADVLLLGPQVPILESRRSVPEDEWLRSPIVADDAPNSSLTIRILAGRTLFATHDIHIPDSVLENGTFEELSVTTTWKVGKRLLRKGCPVVVDFSRSGSGIYGVVGNGYHSMIEFLGETDKQSSPDEIAALRRK